MRCRWAIVLAAIAATAARADPLIAVHRWLPLGAHVPITTTSTTSSSAGRLAAHMAAAGHTGPFVDGTEAAWKALADCRKGDYPGGGSGLFSLPAPGRTNAQSDHCWR